MYQEQEWPLAGGKKKNLNANKSWHGITACGNCAVAVWPGISMYVYQVYPPS